ncbi:MAG: hypothetical protein HY471_03135 [Candidatus Sungbacteria bacterium]|nr:hypothetical protein [Candidatus Sungbacteria bacterium]
MDWRTRRQLTVLLIFSLFIFGIGGGLAFWVVSEPPTCTDDKKNQGEDEPDCGGPCAPCAFKRLRPVEVFFARFIHVRPNTYDVVAQVQNPNDHLAANPLGYRVRVFDDQGAEIATRENVTHLYPNDKIYIIESNFVTERTVDHAAFEIVSENTAWTYTEEIRPELTLGNRKYEVVREGAVEYGRATAELTNRAPLSFRNVEVRVTLLSKEGSVIAAGSTVVADVLAGESRLVTFTWPEKPIGTITRIDMEARANALDSRNLIPL